MSKINELIQTLCPDGVEYKKLGEVVRVEMCRRIKKDETSDSGDVPFYQNGTLGKDAKLFLSRETYEKYKEISKMPKAGEIMLSTAGTIGRTFVYDGKDSYFQDSNIVWLSNDESLLLNSFLFWFCNSFPWDLPTRSTLKHLHNYMITDTYVPILPFAVQDEIVRILNKYTELEKELEAKLSEEIELKQKQYEWYRDELLTFGGDVEYKKLGEVGCVRMCKRIMKDQTSSTGDIPFYKIGTFGGTANAYITQELFDEYSSKYNYPKKGNILISAAGTIGRTVVFDGEPSYFQDSNIVWLEHDGTQVTDEYLKYIYSTSPWYVADGGTISRLYNDNILNAVIPVPSPTEQQRIVKILDKYDTYTRDMISTLNTELESRKKQYAYYRDQLLTFKRKEV